jgi:glycosyltransferase involved in cell wall biosynthesis
MTTVPSNPYIVAVGDADANTNFKGAVWAFDILKYALPDLELWIVGEGPLLADVRSFAESLGWDDLRVRFPGWLPNLDEVLKNSVGLWLTYRSGGLELARRAVALGVPVLAMHNAELAGVPGVQFVPMNDHVAMAAEMLKNLGEPAT